MTVTSTYQPVQYIGNGTTTAFAFPYLFYNNTEIFCSVFDSSTKTTTNWVLGTNFSLSGAGLSSGGTVTALLGAPTATQTLTIQRIAAFTQPTEYTAYGPLPPQSLEQNLDELTFQTQQLNVSIDNSLRAPNTDTNPQMLLPSALLRANQFLAFDASGNPIVTPGSSGGVAISAAMIPVVQAATTAIAAVDLGVLQIADNLSDLANAATARTNLGVGSVVSSIVKQVFTSSGTYTPTSKMVYCIIETVGGGGGGGGSPAASTQSYGGSGGGAGGYSRLLATASTIGASQVVTIGAAGAGGATGGNNGNAGGNTSVGSLCVANGGAGGIRGDFAPPGGSGGGAGTGDIAASGAPGGPGLSSSNNAVDGWSGVGGSGLFGGGGTSATSVVAAHNGIAGTGYGSGGSGACVSGSSSTGAGGSGAPGAVLITEYIHV